MIRIVLIVLPIVVAFRLGLGVLGCLRQRSDARRALKALRTRAVPQGQPIRHDRLPEGLPDPVRRWLIRAVPDGTPMPTLVSARQRGLMRLQPGKPGVPLEARQEYAIVPVGFVWDATIRVSSLPFYGLDSLSEDSALFSGRLLGLIPIFHGSDREVRRSSLLRYLGELVWLPQALARSGSIRWEGVDASRTRAVLESGGETVSGVFEFDHLGRPVSFTATRSREVDGKSVPTPWRGEYGDYVRIDGVEIPSRAKVSWLLPEGPYTYWEAEIGDVVFQR